MVIEFHCQYCKAMIRVPDSAKGGKGRCPKCAMKINVPRKSEAATPPPPPTQAPPKSAIVSPVIPEEEPVVLLAADDDADSGEIIELEAASTEPATAAPLILNETERAKSRIGELPVEPSGRRASKAHPSKAKRGRGKGKGAWRAIGVVLILVSLALGAAYVYLRSTGHSLTGDLVAKTAETLELPPKLIRNSQFKLPSEVIDELLGKLELNPVPLNSQMMRIELRGSPKGLTVSLAAGDQSQFYRVNLNELESVRKFLTENQLSLEERRYADVTNSATEFLESYARVLTKEATSDTITGYRDSLALPSLVGGLGYQLVAQHARNLYRCVYQDDDGGYYFLLPQGLSNFKIIGRPQADGKVLVPVQIEVSVVGKIVSVASDSSGEQTPANAEPRTEDAAPTPDRESK